MNIPLQEYRKKIDKTCIESEPVEKKIMPDTARKNNSALDQPFEFEFEDAPPIINQGKSDKILVHIRSKQYEGDIDLTAQALHSSGEKNHGAIVSVHPSRVRISPNSPATAVAHVSLDPKALLGSYRLGITAKSVRRAEKEAAPANHHANTSASRKQTEIPIQKLMGIGATFSNMIIWGKLGMFSRGMAILSTSLGGRWNKTAHIVCPFSWRVSYWHSCNQGNNTRLYGVCHDERSP
jgi:hypothetical protein